WGNTMENALAEAAYMVGLQNAPGVALACYAPMLSHLQYTNWKPDMLWFDNHRILKTPNYHTQSMFMRHQGDHALLVTATENEPGPILSRPMGGRIFIRADETAVRLSSLRLITPDVTLSYPDCTLSESGELPLHQLDGDFRLEFILERISGNKGILVRFGQLDEENYYQWTVGGWQNSDSGIDTRIRGRGSCLTQSNLYIRDSHAYHMTLEVSGSRITTIVDGEILNQVDEFPLRLRPLYLAASSEEETGDIILKAVNVQDHPVTSELAVPCRSYTTETLSGSPEEANTMDEPDRIQPKVKEIAAPCKAYTFSAHSVTVIRFHQS
ncbi:MAG: alpha-L-arabinofuranosidase, partial [Clostridia bacterium]|nr:alpha-L-arabinofuranosidase [Clostridia bacterium]